MKNIFSRLNNDPIRGFTFIELIVTISIISILSTIILPTFRQVQANARDAKRKGDLKRIQTALENYYEDNRGYPTTSPGLYFSSEANNGGISTNSGNWIQGLTPKYILSLPTDPLRRQNSACATLAPTFKASYVYRSDGTDYKLLSLCGYESQVIATTTDQFFDPARGYNVGLMVCSADATVCNTW